ncbi:MAG: aspartate carbamoyltransferase catalytic subunit [Ignavibacteria bacterium]|nr:aspartate carbamoyltransferase catalytic subunit [Ignavibacteria bacterium]
MSLSKSFNHKHLLSTAQLSAEDISTITTLANRFLKDGLSARNKYDYLQGKTVVSAFFEGSTRTKLSFELAARRLCADVLSFTASASSLSKGESLIDTLHTIDAMGTDMWIVRHSASGAVEFMSTFSDCLFVNAGDGQHEHPTQGLLDILTMQQYFGDLTGKKICIIGDILHSRVARSNIHLLHTLGAEVGLLAPTTLLPYNSSEWKCLRLTTVKEAIDWADCVNILRIQRERMEGGLLPSMEEFSKYYGVKMHHILQKPELLVMHPGPVNYGVEIDHDVAHSLQSVIQKQVQNGVAIRMAVMALLGGNG